MSDDRLMMCCDQGWGGDGEAAARGRGWERGVCTVRSNASWLMVTWGPPPVYGMKHCLLATSFTGGNKHSPRKIHKYAMPLKF